MKITLTKDVLIGNINRKKGQVVDVDRPTYDYLKSIMACVDSQEPKKQKKYKISNKK